MKLKKGLVQIYTGDGKGKTTAAIGQGIRSAGYGLNVVMVQFLKGGYTGELSTIDKINNLIDCRKKEIEKTVNQLKELTEAIGAINQAQVQLKELIEIIEPMYDTLDKLEKICPKTANED